MDCRFWVYYVLCVFFFFEKSLSSCMKKNSFESNANDGVALMFFFKQNSVFFSISKF